MASKHTETYALNQWEAADQVLREDFNADNQKLESALLALSRQTAAKASQADLDSLSAAVAALPRIDYGSYVGTGVCGFNNPTRLDFDFQPLLVFVCANSAQSKTPAAIFVRGQTEYSGLQTYSNPNDTQQFYLTWRPRGLSWYTTRADATPEQQLNDSRTSYSFFAFGL